MTDDEKQLHELVDEIEQNSIESLSEQEIARLAEGMGESIHELSMAIEPARDAFVDALHELSAEIEAALHND